MKKLVYVEWHDHATGARWMDHEDIPDQLKHFKPCYAVGFILHEDKQFLVLGNFIEDDLEASHNRIYILKGCITKRRKLKCP